ncbi:Alpha-L-fucosidase [Planctomycetes bacterium CA13]|uniref:alpha-L-fucosidase n=1 Tax=Novipirellula herctigrandis TaxID=2527986 RepID=A0A5C5YW89_9BACT|nr:Alpha-L-fucosidase [Planctomycetes bacterium CA13]
MRPIRNAGLLVLLAVFAVLGKPVTLSAQSAEPSRMQWWRDARFGMFIHWGLYAVPAGKYKGQEVAGISEWIMQRAKITRSDYEKFAPQFNPNSFDADQWVRIAKDAGMKYIVITSKHHDGFCLFDSQTDYDIVDATPYGKDLLKPLSEACQRQGITFCTYYSIMDWHHRSQLPKNGDMAKPEWNPTKMVEGEKSVYVDYMKEHLRELVVDYKTNVLWFDGEWPDWWTNADGQALYDWLLDLNPKLIVNNRVGAGRKGMSGFSDENSFAGDFGTPEQEIPATGVDSDWESCMTMNGSWGFKASDTNWKSSETLIRNLIDIASKGGNYLLNIGPKADGTFPAASVERLGAMGDWMRVNGESIYGTKSALFGPSWGRVTRKQGALYLHVFYWPSDRKLTIPALANQTVNISLLAAPTETLRVEKGDADWVIRVPTTTIDKVATVIKIEVEGMPELSKTE